MPEFDTLNCIYGALLFVGLGYAIFIVITGGLSDIDMPDVDIDIPGADIQIGGAELPAGGLDAPDVSVSPLSPITVASFITTFGGIGIICTQFFNCRPEWSLVFATSGGLVTSGLMYVFYSQVLIRSQGSSEIRQADLIGAQAEVTIPIGETTTGQVSYVTKSGRMSSMARSIDGKAIPRGQFVVIVRTFGPQVLVRRLPDDMEEKET